MLKEIIDVLASSGPFGIPIYQANSSKIIDLLHSQTVELFKSSHANLPSRISFQSEVIYPPNTYNGKDVILWFSREDNIDINRSIVRAYVLPIGIPGCPSAFKEAVIHATYIAG